MEQHSSLREFRGVFDLPIDVYALMAKGKSESIGTLESINSVALCQSWLT
jgi:hypothetical protein